MKWCVIAGLMGALLAAAAPASARVTRWHLDVDAAYLRGSAHFVTVPIPTLQCLKMDCNVQGIDEMDLTRATLGIGYGTLTVEGAIAIPVRVPSPYRSLSAGFRLQTSADAVIAIVFRFGYVATKVRGIHGMGGRAAIAFLLNFHPAIQIYAEASIEASSTPRELRETGTYLSYVPLVGIGVRASLR